MKAWKGPLGSIIDVSKGDGGVTCITGDLSSDRSTSALREGDGGMTSMNGISSDVSVAVSEGGGGTMCMVGLSSKVTPGRRREISGGDSNCCVWTHFHVIRDFVPWGNALLGDSSSSELCGVP